MPYCHTFFLPKRWEKYSKTAILVRLETLKNPFVKQLLGGLIGATVALVLYGAYHVTAPHVASLIALVHADSATDKTTATQKLEGERWNDVIDLTKSLLMEKSGK